MRVVEPAELTPGTPLRADVERLRAEWLAARTPQRRLAVRGHAARRRPNGTTELVLDLALRTIAGNAAWATPGLTPLTGGVSWSLRAARIVSRPLYDFEGLRRFRARLSPSRWIPIGLVLDRGPALPLLADVLRAFAGGRLAAFAWRSLTRHSNGPIVGTAALLWATGLALRRRRGAAHRVRS